MQHQHNKHLLKVINYPKYGIILLLSFLVAAPSYGIDPIGAGVAIKGVIDKGKKALGQTVPQPVFDVKAAERLIQSIGIGLDMCANIHQICKYEIMTCKRLIEELSYYQNHPLATIKQFQLLRQQLDQYLASYESLKAMAMDKTLKINVSERLRALQSTLAAVDKASKTAATLQCMLEEYNMACAIQTKHAKETQEFLKIYSRF